MKKNLSNANTNCDELSLNALRQVMLQYPLLSETRERELAIRAYNGDRHAREELILCNLRAAFEIANKWVSDRLALEDLIGPAIEGLIIGINKFNPRNGNRVYSFIKLHIEERVQNYSEAMRSGMVLPHRMCNRLSNVRKARCVLEQEWGYSLSDYAIGMMAGDDMNCDALDLESYMRAERFESYDGGSTYDDDDDEPLTWEDRIGDSNNVEDLYIVDEVAAVLRQNLSRLPERTARVLSMLFGLDGECMRVMDVAAELGVSTETVRKTKENGLAALRGMLTAA